MGLPRLPRLPLPLPHQAQHDTTVFADDEVIPRNGFLVRACAVPHTRRGGLRPRGASGTARARDEAVCEAEGEGARPAVLESKNVGQPQETKERK